MRASPAVFSLIVSLLSLSLVPSPLAAGQAQADRGSAGPQQRPSRDEFEGMMEAYVLSKLQESLDLTDEQFGQMVVAQKKLQDARRQYRRKRMEALRELRREVRIGSSDEGRLVELLAQLETLKREFADEERERYRAIDAILSVTQQARYRILEAELERRLRELMRQVRGRMNQQPQRR